MSLPDFWTGENSQVIDGADGLKWENLKSVVLFFMSQKGWRKNDPTAIFVQKNRVFLGREKIKEVEEADLYSGMSVQLLKGPMIQWT